MRICVVSSSSVDDDYYLHLSHIYMNAIMDMDIELLCGGVSSSMMREVYTTFLKNQKKITCYTLRCYHEENICTNTVLLDTTFERTKRLYQSADCICILPGGSGSLAELFSFLEEARTQNAKPIILINENHFFDSLLDSLHTLVEKGFNKDTIFNYICVVTNIDDYKRKMEEYYGKCNNGEVSKSL